MLTLAAKATLIDALCEFAGPRREQLQGFLEGLTFGELEYIADYVGACLMESQATTDRTAAIAGILEFVHQRAAASQSVCEQKALLLIEFVSNSGFCSCLPSLL